MNGVKKIVFLLLSFIILTFLLQHRGRSDYYAIQRDTSQGLVSANCSSFISMNITDESLLTFYDTCVKGSGPNLTVGPELFHRIFVPAVFSHVCKEQQLTFISDQELVALASFPGSGNTWTRALLEQMTGT